MSFLLPEIDPVANRFANITDEIESYRYERVYKEVSIDKNKKELKSMTNSNY